MNTLVDVLLTVAGLCRNHGLRTLFSDVSLGINAGERLGLIGDNGTGKSTFLKLLSGREQPDAGGVALRHGTKVGYLEQLPTFAEPTVYAALAAPFARVRQAIDAYTQLAAEGGDTSAALSAIEVAGGWDWEVRLHKAAGQASAPPMEAALHTLSGGQRKRVALARLILEAPQLVLLDEPTNHLDMRSIAWLESWLVKSTMAAVVVTHDRAFLQNVVRRMAELRAGELRLYKGSYDSYLEARASEEALKERTEARRAQVLKSELEWARRSPSARTTKSRARLQRVDQEQQALQAIPHAAPVADVSLHTSGRLGKTILEFHEVTASYGNKPLFAPHSWLLGPKERWGIVGPNGCGKTTLLRLAQGELAPAAGFVKRGVRTQIAYFDQHRTALDENKLVAQALLPEGGDTVFPGGEPTHVVSYLGRFAFAKAAHTMRVAQLSGGERNRLALAQFLLTPANVLLLDEPTNDLDLLTLSVLEDALQRFAGCVLVVSHDRYFLDKVVTGIVSFEPAAQGYTLSLSQGDWTMYAKHQAAATPATPAAAAPTKVAEPRPKGRPGLSFRDRQELAGMESCIEAAEAKHAALEAQLCDPAVWRDDPEGGKAVQDESAQAAMQVTRLYARWEELLARQQTGN